MIYSSPIGKLEIKIRDEKIFGIDFNSTKKIFDITHPFEKEIKSQMDGYFSKKLKKFDLPLELIGTDFQKKVWSALLTIPHGKLVSYQDIAIAINNPKAQQAVGGANGKNPIPIIVPCHRVIGKNGTLTGYSGGLNIKEFLLNLETQSHSGPLITV